MKIIIYLFLLVIGLENQTPTNINMSIDVTLLNADVIHITIAKLFYRFFSPGIFI